MTGNQLLHILDDMEQHKRDKQQLLVYYINERLNKSLESYYKELSDSLTYLAQRNEKNVLKKLNRME